jgi:hypothetical protein
VWIDLTPPELVEASITERSDGKRILNVKIEDPKVNGVRSGLNSDGPVIQLLDENYELSDEVTNQNNNRVHFLAYIQPKGFQTASLNHFQIKVLGDNADPIGPEAKKVSIQQRDTSSNLLYSDFPLNQCLSKAMVRTKS